MRFDPMEDGKKATYFRMIESIVPRPIAWVSTISRAGTHNLAPFSFFTGVTSDPATLLFCCGNRRNGDPKDTAQNCIDTGVFVVNCSSYSASQQMVQTSAAYPADIDEFEAAGIDFSPSETVAAPRVRDAAISFECDCHDITEVKNDEGCVTSRIIIGRIKLIHIDDAVLDAQGRVDVRALDAISRLGGHDYARIGEVFTIPRPKREL